MGAIIFMYSSVIFDLDGTILNTIDDLARAGNHALAALGLPIRSVDYYKTIVGHGIKNLVFTLLPQDLRGTAAEDKAYALFCSYYESHMFDLTKPYDGITPMLHTLRENGLKLAVLSNKDDKLVQIIIQMYFSGLIDFALGFSDDFPPKPDPASAQHLIRRLAEPAHQVLYVGDSGVDIITAHNASLYACGVTWGFRSRMELTEAGADILVDSPLELQHYILPDLPFICN